MKRIVKFLVVSLFFVLTVLTIYKINPVRYFSVRAVWKAIDWAGNKSADKASLPQGVKIETDIPYEKDSDSQKVLDIYYPEGEKNKHPVVIYIHGGGFVAGDKRQTKPFCMTLAKEGFVVFNINYGLAPRSRIMSQITDILSAMSWIKDNCDKYFGDTSNIILAGDSAGAYLSSITACIITNNQLASTLKFSPVFSEKEIKAVLLFSGVYDLKTGAKSGFPSIKSDIEMALGSDNIESYENIDNLSVTKNITPSFPNVFISSGEIDWLYPESAKLIQVLDKNGIYHKDLLFDKTEKKAMHSYHLHLELETSKQCVTSVIDFLKTELRR